MSCGQDDAWILVIKLWPSFFYTPLAIPTVPAPGENVIHHMGLVTGSGVLLDLGLSMAYSLVPLDQARREAIRRDKQFPPDEIREIDAPFTFWPEIVAQGEMRIETPAGPAYVFYRPLFKDEVGLMHIIPLESMLSAGITGHSAIRIMSILLWASIACKG